MVRTFQRKEPLLEAMQFDGTVESAREIMAWAPSQNIEWYSSTRESNIIGETNTALYVPTGDGAERDFVKPGDFVIKPDPTSDQLLVMTYEKIFAEFTELIEE